MIWEEKRREEINELIIQSAIHGNKSSRTISHEIVNQEKKMIREVMKELYDTIPDVYNLSWPVLKSYINKILTSKDIKEI